MLGEQFEEPNVIGTSLSLRQNEQLLQIWLKDGRDDRLRVNVSNKLRHFLNLDPSVVTLYYKEHVQSIKDGSTLKNAEGFKFMRHQQTNPKVFPRGNYSNGGQNFHQNARGPRF
jgi:hypothetical protein